jgi:shikimate kinase
MKETNYTLIGMPTAGKTYLGKKLAIKLNKKWDDLDTASYGQTLKEGGSEGDYLKSEEQVLLAAKGKNSIFSCGGSSIYSEKGMKHLKSISEIIYLKLPLKVIKERIGKDYLDRGIVGSGEKTIEELYAERTKLYERYADITVNCESNSTEEQLDNLCRLIQK